MASDAPILCAVVARTRHKMMQVEIQEAAKQGAKLVEVRLDFLAKQPDFHRILDKKPCPLMATVRRVADGGRWGAPEDGRQVLLRQAIVAGFDWVDLETDIAGKIKRFGKTKRVISYHNMREVPDDLEDIYAKMCEQDPDVCKLAVTAQSIQDNLRVVKLLKNATKPIVAFCMGDLGTCTRVLCAKFGAPIIYSVFNKERTIAPGMLSFAELKKVYRVENVHANSKVFGVIGDPVGHSLSPLLHNRAFQKLGVDGVYIPFRVPRGDLAACLKGLEEVPVQGYSVTIPHKEEAAELASTRDALVEKIGAANTLIRSADGWRAFNTDAPAAVASLRAHLGSEEEPALLSSRMILILGAGGVARAIAFALANEGAGVAISNRTAERAQQLAQDVGCKSIDWAARHNFVCDIVINCTSVGMFPNVDESPLHNSFLRPGLVVFDTIYTPETTLLIREARNRACSVITGVDMFVRQAGMQFRLFTGKAPPYDLMRDTMKRYLSPVNLSGDDVRA